MFGGAHAVAMNFTKPYVENGHIHKSVAEIIGGGVGGFFQGMVLSPVLLLKTRVMTNEVFREKMSVLETTKKSTLIGLDVIKKEGVGGLMTGCMTFSLKRVADWSSRFLFVELVEEFLFGNIYKIDIKDRTTNQKLVAGLLGGVLSSIVTLPMDVMVAQKQQSKSAGQKITFKDVFMREYAKGGISQVIQFTSRGFIARTLHVSLTTALMKTITSVVYNLIYN